nr:LLM class flavin-dependent oxidoreductase [Roseovarius autotrophicus]
MFPLVRARKLPRAEARARAEESVDVVARLSDSWPDDAYPRDKVSGQFFRPEAFAPIHHKGPHFAVRGPLNVPRSPQGRPVIFQAGASEPGKVLAARSADGVFTATQTLADGQAYYRNLKRRLPGHGRAAGDVLVMPGIFPVIGRTRAEAEDRFAALQDLLQPVVAISHLSNLLGHDVSGFDPHGPLPDLPASVGHVSRQQVLIDRARRDNLSILDLALSMAGARGYWQITGTPPTSPTPCRRVSKTGWRTGSTSWLPSCPVIWSVSWNS